MILYCSTKKNTQMQVRLHFLKKTRKKYQSTAHVDIVETYFAPFTVLPHKLLQIS